MAESKRLSLGGRVATPRLSSVPSQPSMDQVLARCIGAQIRVQTAAPGSRTVTGHIFAVSPSSPVLTLTPAAVPAGAGAAPTTSFTVIPISSIQTFTLLELASSATPTSPTAAAPRPAPLPSLDTVAIQNRLRATTSKLLEQEARLGKGVTVEAQAIFDGLSRTLGCRWDGERIIVLDAVVIEPPYGPTNCKAGKGVSAQTLPRIQKVLESERKKIQAKNGPMSRSASGTGEKKGG